jgi:hypothetical protein
VSGRHFHALNGWVHPEKQQLLKQLIFPRQTLGDDAHVGAVRVVEGKLSTGNQDDLKGAT